ncbi:uncharacterized protein LOC125022858 [Mugil cephalus]|uniref:uncharacterized protein LOC125022858 n=1 Tax=Mugil cephalus TaxID=48193 RepID=UPI001FB6220D|nr:uncharacterized protein LOC125022858 [Mugil cephalus]
MGPKVEGSVFWSLFLVLFPVAVGLPSPNCVNYKHRTICALKGSSVVISCSYPDDVTVLSVPQWSKGFNHKLESIPLDITAYEIISNGLNSRTKDCSIKFTNTTKNHDSIYYITYKFSRKTDEHMTKTCHGSPGVRIHIFLSPVLIMGKDVVKEKDFILRDWSVMEGQRITLTCVHNCAADLTSNIGYIWYKNRLQLNDSKRSLLPLHPVNKGDTGSYACAMIGYEDFPSPVVNLRVQNGPIGKVSDNGIGNDTVPKDTRFTPLFIVVVASVPFGWFITITITIVLICKRKKRRGCAGSTSGAPNPGNDPYTALDVTSMSRDYAKLDPEGRSSAADTVYENLHQPQSHMR